MDNYPLIPYFQTTRYRIEAMIRLAQIKTGDLAADLGSGDGRIVIAFAHAGAQAYGYEIDATLQQHSEENIKQKGLTNATILHKNFWYEDLSPYSIITLYGMPDIMLSLQKKIERETHHGTRILSNYYPFPGWTETAYEDNIYLYIK